MLSNTKFVKDPDAVLDYVVDWSNNLDTGDTIASHTIIADSGIEVETSTNTTTTVTAWLSGGTAGQDYNVVFRAVTQGGRTDDRSIRILVRQR